LGIARAIGPREAHFARAYETREIVDVPVGLIVEYTLAEPDEVAHAQVVAQLPLDVAALEVRIAIGVQQAFLGDQRRALTVDVDGAAFVHQRGAVAIEPLDVQHLARHEIILVPRKIQSPGQAAPRVEAPVDAAYGAAPVHYAGGPDITHPGIIVRHLHHAHALGQQRARGAVVRGRRPDRDRLELRDGRRPLHT